MIKNTRRRGLVALLLLALGMVFYLEQKQPAKLEVDFLDVGQGDSILIKTPNQQVILIDGGPDNVVLRRLGENLPFYRRRIDLIISSHYHDDHATGLVEITKRYRVGKIIYQANSSSSPIFETFLNQARERNILVSPLSGGVKISFGPDCFLSLWPLSIFNVPKDPNNSLIVKLDCAEQNFLFSGDNSSRVEKILLKFGLDLEADVFKISHHGSNSANSEEFLQAVNPQLTVISVGADNRFGHPAPAVLERLQKMGIEVKRTDEGQTIKIFSQ
jgi:competence protein ComEC